MLPLALSACATLPLSDTRPDKPAVQSVLGPDCVVVASRQVQLIGERSSASRPVGTISGQRINTSLTDDAPPTPTEGVIGGGSRAPASTIEGRKLSPTPMAVEYIVREGTSERLILQNSDFSGVILPSGMACRIVGTGSNARLTWA